MAQRIDPELYAELVLRCVEQVPPGRVTTYGAIAEVVGELVGGGGPRQVGSVMAGHGGAVPWWRVVHADGSPPGCHDGEARLAYLAEGTPLRTSGKVDLRAAFVSPTSRRRPVSPAGSTPRRPAGSPVRSPRHSHVP